MSGERVTAREPARETKDTGAVARDAEARAGRRARVICPACQQDVTFAAAVGGVTVCPTCGRSVVLEGAKPARLATKTDVAALTEAELTQVRKARNRPKRRLRA